ncbi:MAG: hypothetical protein AABM67_08395 [Acidobacteriota bacterium]
MSATAKAIETPTLDLSALRRMKFSELEALYRAGTRPSAISDLDGHARGAMLAWRTPAGGPIAWLLRTFGASSIFPWEGKSFASESREAGTGINRINLFRKMRWFPFKTRFEPSFLDGQPSFRLDYSGPANPPLIRSIVDEVREVAPRLYLGPAALLVGGKPRPILFFAVSLQSAD